MTINRARRAAEDSIPLPTPIVTPFGVLNRFDEEPDRTVVSVHLAYVFLLEGPGASVELPSSECDCSAGPERASIVLIDSHWKLWSGCKSMKRWMLGKFSSLYS